MTAGSPKWVERLTLLTLIACAPMAAAPAMAQEDQEEEAPESHVPLEARSLIVAIRSYQPGRNIAQFGAGIVTGVDDDRIYIATALHVVKQRDQMAERIFVSFESQPGDSLQAEVVHVSDDAQALDLAFISVPVAGAPDAFMSALDRLGESVRLRAGDAVSPIGCPDEVCWGAPSPPDRVLLTTPLEVVFQSNFTKRGSSGGGLFDRWWEVVGLVTRVDPPRADAIPMKFIVEQAETWNVPVTLRRPKIPRGWYRNTVKVDILFPSASPGDLFPSLRATFSHSVRRPLTIDASYLRLAPGELTGCPPEPTSAMILTPQQFIELEVRQPCAFVMNAGVIGVGLDINRGRFAAHPFVEGGIAQQEARVDDFGFFLEGDPPVYQPANRSDEQTSVVVGGGLAVDFVVVPRLIVEVLAAYWSFEDPFLAVDPLGEFDNPDVPHFYFGFGVGLGL